jgi:hypothetical protein
METGRQAAAEVVFAAGLMVWALDGLDSAGWSRTLRYNFPAPATRDISWLATHTLHEAEHHLQDLDRGLEVATNPA